MTKGLAPVTLRHLDPEGEVLAIDPSRWVKQYQEVQGYPLMEVDMETRRVIRVVGGRPRVLNRPLPHDTSLLDSALAHIETYVESVGACEAQALDPQYAMTSIYEALLFFLAAPFAHERMKVMRSAFGPSKSKGPKSLYIYGATNNGKSSLAKFALKLLAGQHVKPLTNDDYKKDRLLAAANMGGVFPAVFDDVLSLSKDAWVGGVFKGYWEASWRETCSQPALIFTCNRPSVPDWAKSRVHRLDFDVVFADNAANSVRLADLLEEENPVFGWFAERYLDALAELKPGVESRSVESLAKLDDELALARETMTCLYQHAARPLPGYFPTRPVHETYSPEPKRLADMIQLGKIVEKKAGNRLILTFAEDLEDQDVKELASYVPQEAKPRRRGRTLIIEGVPEYESWVKRGRTGFSLWSRVTRWFSG